MVQYIGIDIGGTKIEGVLVNKQLKVLKRVKRSTEAHKSRSKIISNIVAVSKELETNDVKGIGVGAPGFTDSKGKIQLTPNITKFKNFGLKKALEEKLKRKISIANDAHCFVLAEQKIGAAKGMKNIIGLTLGTGVGGGAIVDGKLLEGKSGGAAHFGHMIIDPSGAKCKCGLRGDLESWCGGKHIEKRYKQMSGKSLGSEQIFASKDKAAGKVIRDVYQKLGIGIANLINAFNPEVVVLGGSISKVIDTRKLGKEVTKYVQAPLAKEARIVKGKSSAAIGAACLVN